MSPELSRRAFVIGGAALLGLAACSDSSSSKAAGSKAGSSSGSSSGSGATGSGATASDGTTTAPTTAAPRGPARFADSGPTDTAQIALTFHTSGDPAKFAQLTDILRQRNVVMTAFVVGQWLDANVELGRQLHAAGHELANHTYTHPGFESLGADAKAEEIARCRAAIARVVPDGGRLFRPSGTADGTVKASAGTLAAAGDGGYPVVVGFDIDPFDYQDPGVDAIVQRTVAKLHAGAVISLHFDHDQTIAALPRILDAIDSKGLQPVTASTLLG